MVDVSFAVHQSLSFSFYLRNPKQRPPNQQLTISWYIDLKEKDILERIPLSIPWDRPGSTWNRRFLKGVFSAEPLSVRRINSFHKADTKKNPWNENFLQSI